MLTRRKLVLGAALAVLVPAAPALAAPDPLLADILYGVSDALHLPQLRVRPLGRPVLVVQRQPLHARHLPPLLDRRLLQALSSACAPSAASGSQASARSGPAPAAFRRSRPQAAACRRSGAPSSARRRSASASLRRAGRQGPGRSRRSPLTPLRLNRLRAGHEREIRSM